MAKCIIAALPVGASFIGAQQYLKAAFRLAPVVQKVDNAIHRINLYPVDSAILLVSLMPIHWIVIYPIDSTIQCLNNRGPIASLTVIVEIDTMAGMISATAVMMQKPT